jgi:hypothetical protein
MTAKTIRMTMPLEVNSANQYVDYTEQQSAARLVPCIRCA